MHDHAPLNLPSGADEQELLTATIQESMGSGLTDSALTAAFTALAIFTRNTLETVEALVLSTELQQDWTLDLSSGHIKRLPSRPHVRWRQDADSEPWTKPLAKQWIFALDSTLLEVLRRAQLNRPAARRLGDLWTSEQSPYSAFRATLGNLRLGNARLDLAFGQIQRNERGGNEGLVFVRHVDLPDKTAQQHTAPWHGSLSSFCLNFPAAQNGAGHKRGTHRAQTIFEVSGVTKSFGD